MRLSRGFTLLELMVVVAIIAILAAIAIPSYQSSIAKSRRADAQGALQGLAQAMERFQTNNGTYMGAATAGADTGKPAIFADKSPIDGSQTYYDLTIKGGTDTPDATSYVLVATAVNGQLGDGNLELESTGARRWDRGNDGFGTGNDQCWEITCN